MSQSLQSILLSKFERFKGKLLPAADSDLKAEIMAEIHKEISTEYGPEIGNNIFKLLKYLVLEKKFDFDDLIKLLVKNNDLDKFTNLREQSDDFDSKYGTVTSPILSQYEIPETMSLNRMLNSSRYHPSPIAAVNEALNALQKFNIDYGEFTFIDVGSGLGRNLLLASGYSFKRIVGLEHSDYLHAMALKNVESYISSKSTRNKFDLKCMDALQYSFPDENMVLYFWWPFTVEIGDIFIKKLTDHLIGKPYKVLLIFLEFVYPEVERAAIFLRKSEIISSDISFREGTRFSLKIYSN